MGAAHGLGDGMTLSLRTSAISAGPKLSRKRKSRFAAGHPQWNVSSRRWKRACRKPACRYRRRQPWNVQPYATSSEPVRNAPRLCAVSTEVVEADSASNAIDDCVLVACDFWTHIDCFAWYTGSILPCVIPRVISAYATRRGASDALTPSGADNVDARPHLDGEGAPR
jgi:hypothetical protein